MDNSSNTTSSFTTTHFMIYFITTALLLMSLIYCVSGCQSRDYSIGGSKAVPETHQEGGHE
ncbi:MAG: hypothetical protein ABI723_05340 [Bacteroidia bacterium]